MADERILWLGASGLIAAVLVITGLWVPILSVVQQPFFLGAPTSVEPGEQFQVDVSTVNFEGGASSWTGDPCYGSGVDTGIEPELVFYEGESVFPSSIFNIVETSGWSYVGGAVGYEYTYTLQADALTTFSGDVTIESVISCLDGSTDTQSTSVTLESIDDGTNDGDDGTDGGTGDGGMFNLETVRPAQVSTSDGRVVGSVALENTGDAMQSNAIVEMQVRPTGAGALSFVSGTADACDPNFPENVHKEFRLGAGESRTIELVSEPEPGQRYDVYMLTQEGCFDEADSGPLDPYNNGIKVASDICVGTCEEPPTQGVPWLLVILASVLLTGGLVYLGVRLYA